MLKKENCLDCLYCKVSARSTKNCRLCYCAKRDCAKRHKEQYYFAKKVCENFESMAC